MPVRRFAVAIALAIPIAGGAAFSAAMVSPIRSAHAADEAPKIIHVRGTLTAAEGRDITVKTSRGETVPLKLTDAVTILLASKSDLASIKPNSFVGITSVERDGKRVAREVHVFAEDLRGIGVGHYPWDLEGGPNMMTNGNVAKVNAVGGEELKVEYPGGNQDVTLPADVPVVSIGRSTLDQLKPGRQVFMFVLGAVEPGAKVSAIVVGEDGVKPPM